MASRVTTVVFLYFFVLMGALAQSAADLRSSQDTQVRGYWIDPATGLMWAGRDNGTDVTWKEAMKYCRKLQLAGHSDWKLATLDQLQGIYDKNAKSPGLAGPPHRTRPFTWNVEGNLFLTGVHWSSSRIADDRGRPSGYALRFDFKEGRSFDGDEISFYSDKRALCVRGTDR